MSSATALLADAESSISAGAWDQALEQLESLKQSDPKEPDVYKRLAHVQSIRGKFLSVVQTYVDLIAVLVEEEQLSEAESVVGTVLALKPECESAREKRIEIEKKRGNIDRAVYLARELARLCIEQGDGDRSIRLLQEAQSDQPENLDISLELAEMFVSHGQIQDGANQYRKVANAFQEAGDISKAAEAYRRMKVVQSDDPDVLLTLGRLYTELGKLDEAEQEFRSVLRHDLEHQDALLELGFVCQLKGRFRSGLLAFNKVLQNNPKLPRAMRKLGELNLSMGKQDGAVQHFLEAAQAYLEVEEREQAIEIFQIVLGVEEGNAQAQQGLTNLGAPLDAIEFQPPLPPTPPDDEPPTPESGPVSASDLGELPPAQVEPEPDPPKAEKEKAKSTAPKSSSSASKGRGLTGGPTSGSKGRRKGLVSGGLGLRKGLVDPSAGGGKPMLGKPTLGGGGGSTRAGLRRPGLGMKGGPGDKPMLGMSKPTLNRRRAPEPEVLDEPESVFAEPEPEVAEAPMPSPESVFESAEMESGLESELEVAANDLFDSDTSSPFDEGLADSLFDDSESEVSAAAPVIGAFSSQDDSDGAESFGGLKPGFDPGPAGETGGESADDIFDLAGAGDLFGEDDDDSSSGDLFGDDALPAASIFGDDEGEQDGAGDDLFGGLSDSGEPPTAKSEEPADDLFGGDQFDNLFDEPESEDRIASSDTIASLGAGGTGDDLFSDDSSSGGPDDSAFSSLFSEAPSEEAMPATDDLGDDLFATSVDSVQEEPAEQAIGGLFDEPSSESSDLFGEDLFPSQEPMADQSAAADLPGAEPVVEDLFGGDDLFGEASSEESLIGSVEEAGEGAADLGGDLFSEPSTDTDSLFEEAPSDDLFGGDDLFGDAAEGVGSPTSSIPDENTATEEEFDLFSDVPMASEPEPLEQPLQDEPGGSLFEGFDAAEDETPEAPESNADDLFGGGDDLFGGGDTSGGLFGEPDEPVGQANTMTETAIDFAETPAEADGSGLFDEIESADAPESGGDLFDIPAPDSGGSLFDEPAADAPLASEDQVGGLFEEAPEPQAESVQPLEQEEENSFDDSESLFDAPPVEAEMAPAAPLGLELPMPGDEPVELEEPEPEPVEAAGGSLFDEPSVEVVEELDEDALTIDKLRAEEMAKVVDVPVEERTESPEFMKLLEMTLPRAEEELLPEADGVRPSGEEVPSPDLDAQAPQSGDLFDEAAFPSGEESEGDLFGNAQADLFEAEVEPEPEPEPEPIDEGPHILGKPKVSLSIEDESPAADTEEANHLDSTLSDADVAAKIGAYRKALEDAPENIVMRTRLADIHLKYGMLEDALLQYRQVARKNPESISLLHRLIQAEFWTENYPEAGESLLALAKLHLKRGEHHDALDTLQSVLSLDSHHFEARKVLVSVFTTLDESKLAAHHLRQLAETALTKGEVEEAVSAFQQLLDISNDPVFEERLAQIYESQGDMERALTSFQSLVGRYQQEERWEEAARVTERIVELNPELLDDRGALVELYKKLGMQDKAMEQQFKLAHAYQERGELEPSIRLYEGVLQFSPDNQDARRLLVDAYLDSGNVSAALEQGEALTEHYLNTKDHNTAIELYTRLVGADPENVELQERLVKFYGLAGDLESAKVRWVQLADLHEERERFAKAAEAIQKALELDDSQVELQHRLALLYAEKLDDKVAALTQFRKLFQMAPERLDAVQMYIDILLKEEQVSEAGQVLQQLEQAGGDSVAIKNDVIASLRDKVESNPSDLKARFNYGELCYHLGDLDHAIEQFQQTRRNPEFELLSYNMLGLCFANKKGFNMLDLAIKQFKKGLETRGHSEQSYLELRYNLAMIQYQNGRVTEALNDFKECYRIDITYRDVRSWIEKVESELASSGS